MSLHLGLKLLFEFLLGLPELKPILFYLVPAFRVIEGPPVNHKTKGFALQKGIGRVWIGLQLAEVLFYRVVNFLLTLVEFESLRL
jgi:hypothetical protein